MLTQAGQDGGDRGFTVFTRLDAGLHQTAQLGLGAHVAAKGFDGVVVEAGFVEEEARLGGFAAKRHVFSPAESASEKCACDANDSV